ncbi:MAG: NAD(+) synthase [Clostridiales bacterium]|nr:NAD(+) synthase [Clostridiales bacterium]
MRIVCAAAGGKPADVRLNVEGMWAVIARARADGARLVVLPQLCLTGIGCGDLFYSETLTDAALDAAQEIALATADLTCVYGLPVRTGGHIVSMAAVAQNGRLLQLVPNSVPPGQWFAPGAAGGHVNVAGHKVPVSRAHIKVSGKTVTVRFSQENTQPAADITAVVGGEPFLAGAGPARAHRFVQWPGITAYANASVRESTTDRVYDGQLLVLRGGKVLSECPPFSPDAYLLCDADASGGVLPTAVSPPDPRFPYAPGEGAARDAWCRDLTRGAARALATRMENICVHHLTLGVSGGLDSAHALLVSVEALRMLSLPLENLVAVSLPAFGSTRRTQDNAARLMAGLGVKPRVIPIGDSVRQHFNDIGHSGETHDAAYENAQARERTQVLMDLANMVGGLMVGPGDLSELALGFTTYGGDHMSMYAVNSGLPKTAIRMILAAYAEDHAGSWAADALIDILNTPVSPELLPPKDGEMAQHTEDIVGPYDLNDFFLYHFLRDYAAPADLMARAHAAFAGQYNRHEIARWMRNFFKRFFASQFKRS